MTREEYDHAYNLGWKDGIETLFEDCKTVTDIGVIKARMEAMLELAADASLGD